MKVKEKLFLEVDEFRKNGPINIVTLGDSITQGSFEIGVNNYDECYSNRLRRKLNAVSTNVPVNIINAGMGGTTAPFGLERFDRDVTPYKPDLVIVSFGLNDVNYDLDLYLSSLKGIFEKCLANNFDTIFMTECMMNTYVADDVNEKFVKYAHQTAEFQNSGKVDLFFSEASKLAKSYNIEVADCYLKWKELYNSGVDTTQLLSNKINHPTFEMHELFADELFKIIMK